nr:MAG TPA: hypothetical protein [Caudoviricetes sp.]DAU83659.1 MAG TPA: hypothetical protein [Caudoviricetes sp.]DAZ34027.1 MAG TPA: hypothetical protein [Caudoviricetes sp.]DAZ46052.1 MAG TPA: hypothetical protein [Caudoviricetes sp.]
MVKFYAYVYLSVSSTRQRLQPFSFRQMGMCL